MAHHPGWVITPVGSRYTGAVTTEGRGWPDQRPKGEVTRHDASLKHDNRQVFRQTEQETERLGALGARDA